MKRLAPLTLAFILAQCQAQVVLQGTDFRLIPDCGPKVCGVSYYVSHLNDQDLIEFGFESGKFYYRRSAFFNHGTFDSHLPEWGRD